MWLRLGMDPNDKSTWSQERVHMPVLNREEVATFAPKVNRYTLRRIASCIDTSRIRKAWGAIVELLGGEDRIDEAASSWGDSFIVNFGTPECADAPSPDPRDLNNWHVDGDFFIHYLDSPEQALLVIPVFSDIKPRGGGTYIAPGGVDMVAQYLLAHPEGVIPENLTFRPSTSTAARPEDDPGFWSHLAEAKKCTKFVEVTGDVGDVVLLHPLMLHTASKNNLRVPRVITNPPVGLREPFNFNRDDPDDYSLVERKTLRALGVEKIDFVPTTQRRRIVPARVLREQAMLAAERERLSTQPPIAGVSTSAVLIPVA